MSGRSFGFLSSSDHYSDVLKLPTDTSGEIVFAMTDCARSTDFKCRDTTAALHLKVSAIAVILTASSLGVIIPLIGRRFRILRTDGNFFFICKAFAAGVILATGFVHMLPDAETALSSPCLPEKPWAQYPWAGAIAMVAALATLIVDFAATEYYENRHVRRTDGLEKVGDVNGKNGLIKGDEEKQESGDGSLNIVGMRAHAASHSHSHPEGHHECVDVSHPHVHGHVGHSTEDGSTHIRHIVIAQVLEFGIVAHSVIIGVTLGVSDSPCTIRPLFAALCFHQFFEGFALGGCISQAGFRNAQASVMALFFALTTPLGIAIGIGIASSYNDNSPRALIVQGVFDAISAGILVYMALVDLIAADFLSKRLRCNRRLQVYSYLALFAGAGAMALLGYWA